MSNGVVTYLPRLFGGGKMNKLYEFVDDSEPTIPPELSLQEWARRCSLAAAAVEIEKAGLAEAQNQVVQCEGAVIKAETLLERQQRGYLDCASKIPGVPCPKS
jgi:hypothetical protein